ncbi:glycosyltransferase family 2 protein [Leptolyngbya sp. FACHB-671]|uniref:glycosyltransferase n=1 Tax=Leptolyngbya sp. FACHB-671 TaxID=2692812 RepID=UPI001685DAB7|nr:glycosyltransferase family 2 protein [Leptolyngbya sp. FACHB-671]MBD2072209.1 glycosyltransferase family 2 protein [Leptolyngbya sp. FACHB-671]
MPENSWLENDSYSELEPISSLLTDLTDSKHEASATSNSLHRGLKGRRRKAVVVLTLVWSGTVALHLVSWGYWFVLGLTTLMGIHALRILFARPIAMPEPLAETDPEACPYVSLLVAAKNEEAVVVPLVKTLCNLDYPDCRYDLWVIDDNSSDRTPILLDHLAEEYPQLRVIHRSASAGGGKSGALNEVYPITKGEIIAVFDADAQVPGDLLRRVLPMFERKKVGAVQVRKAIANASANFWTRNQVAEMALDSYLQQQRLAIGGIGELRGNGQFVRREALDCCGGWNEETITDDLDLTFKLHLDQWDIDFLSFPPVGEEGVTRPLGLWHQRNRWAEGGYQRYLDYWRLILSNRMGTRKTVDLFMFWVTQYVMPTAAVPDFLMAIARNRVPIFSPIASLTIVLFIIGMVIGLRRTEPDGNASKVTVQSLFLLFFQTLQGTVYMFHWLPIVASMTFRVSLRRKRLKWVKTIHHGIHEPRLNLPKS